MEEELPSLMQHDTTWLIDECEGLHLFEEERRMKVGEKEGWMEGLRGENRGREEKLWLNSEN